MEHRCVVLAFHVISKQKLVRLVKATMRGRHPCSFSGECGHSARRSSEGVVVTFDDGTSEMVEIGADVAKEQGWPTIFYLPTGYIDGHGLWQEELTTLCRHARPGRYTVFGQTVELGAPGARTQVKDAVVAEMLRSQPCDLGRIRKDLRSTLDQAGTAPVAEEMPQPTTWARVKELAHRPEITFGSHTVSHRPMAIMTEQEIHWELSESKRRLEEVIGQSVEHFCYPFGSVADIGRLAPRLVGNYYKTAVTLVRGLLNSETSRSRIPRIDLYENDHPMRVRAKILAAKLGWTR